MMTHAQRHRHLTVLLVEDDDDVRSMISWMLKGDNFTVHSFKTSHEALAEVDSHPERFDAAVCDVMLQGSEHDGLELADLLTKKGMFPVVVVTAAPSILLGREVPPHIPMLTKPFNADELRAVLATRRAK